MAKLHQIWNRLLSSQRFLPMPIVADIMAFALIAPDRVIGNGWVDSAPWVYRIQADGARGLLATLAGSVMVSGRDWQPEHH